MSFTRCPKVKKTNPIFSIKQKLLFFFLLSLTFPSVSKCLSQKINFFFLDIFAPNGPGFFHKWGISSCDRRSVLKLTWIYFQSIFFSDEAIPTVHEKHNLIKCDHLYSLGNAAMINLDLGGDMTNVTQQNPVRKQHQLWSHPLDRWLSERSLRSYLGDKINKRKTKEDERADISCAGTEWQVDGCKNAGNFNKPSALIHTNVWFSMSRPF